MVFVDPLTIMLVAVAASLSLIAWYLLGTAKGKRNLSNLAVPMFVLGLFDFISGFYMSFAWPFPAPLASYNMLFGDPMLFLGIILLSGGYMLYETLDVRVLSWLGFLIGIYLAVETIAIITLQLEKGIDLYTALGLYGFSALSALLSPLVYFSPKNHKSAYYLLAGLLILAAFFAILIGSTGIYMHLASPP